MRTPSQSISLIRPLGADDNSLWLAEQSQADRSTREITARRFNRSDLQNEADREDLRQSVEIAKRIEHGNVAKVFGYAESEDEIILLMEHIDGISLARLLEHVRAESKTLDPRLSIWIIREVVRTLNELSAQMTNSTAVYCFSEKISLTRIVASRSGQIKISDLGRKHAEDRQDQVEVILNMLATLSKVSVRALRLEETLIDTSEVFSSLLEQGIRDLSTLESALDRIFYRTYGADDDRHGTSLLRASIIDIVGETTQPNQVEELGSNRERARTENDKGELTQALESRYGPVVPQALTFADRVTGLETLTASQNMASEALAGPESIGESESRPEAAITDAQSPSLVNTPRMMFETEAISTPAPPTRIIWFTIGFVSAIGSMVLYFGLTAPR